ncbi:tonsoku-like protein, partial [Mobula birostris]|uniref:tonsoku-like protein n=1 Tax=Mobula birostris TaxID=1983395 RepID=UPI003B27E31A
SQNFFTDLYRATYILGTIHQDQELYTQALKYYQAARQWAHKAGMQGESDTAVSQGQVQLTLGEFAAASLHLQKALSQNTIPSDQRNTVRKQLNRALKGERLQRELQAIPENHYDSRLHLYEELGDLCCSVRCYQKGVEYYQDQLACAQRLCCPGKQMAVIHWSLARTYDDLKDYGQALMHYQKELELQKGNDQEECRTLLHMVEVQQKMGTDQTEVEGSLQAAVYHAERSGNSRLQWGIGRQQQLCPGPVFQGVVHEDPSSPGMQPICTFETLVHTARVPGEAQFQIQQISSDSTRYYDVVSSLDQEAAARVEDFLQSPLEGGKYAAFKALLIGTFGLSWHERGAHLLHLDVMGHRSPPLLPALQVPGKRQCQGQLPLMATAAGNQDSRLYI